MTFLVVNLMFSRLDKFDEPIFWEKGGGVFTGDVGRELMFGMLIGLHIWEEAYIREGLYTGVH